MVELELKLEGRVASAQVLVSLWTLHVHSGLADTNALRRMHTRANKRKDFYTCLMRFKARKDSLIVMEPCRLTWTC